MEAQEVVDLLKQGVVSLSFTKVKDGAVRNMLATLRADLIPEDKMPKSGNLDESVVGQSAVRCFDVDLGEWRSFRPDTLIKVSLDD